MGTVVTPELQARAKGRNPLADAINAWHSALGQQQADANSIVTPMGPGERQLPPGSPFGGLLNPPQIPQQSFQPAGPYGQLAQQMAGQTPQNMQQLFGSYRGLPPNFFNRGLI